MNNSVSIVIPAYNEGSIIKKTASTINSILNKAKISHEIIFIDDGSKDDTWERISSLCESKNNNRKTDANKKTTAPKSKTQATIRGIRFSRNFGKESAIMAGLQASTGDCCVVIDCDLQHPPEKIVDMYKLWQDGYEIIEGIKSDRGKENKLHKGFVSLFYSLISKAVGIDMKNTSDYKLLDRKAVDAITQMPEKYTFFRALSSWVGFKTTYIEYEVQERESGESKWSNVALAKYALRNIASFSSAPMQIVTVLGCITLLISIVFGCIALIQKIYGIAIGGFTTIIVLMLFTSSIIMISLGIIGYYIAKIYEEIKQRPRYIISEMCGENK